MMDLVKCSCRGILRRLDRGKICDCLKRSWLTGLGLENGQNSKCDTVDTIESY